ncbi:MULTISPECIES: ParB/RepB/Spo0J family partition protein [Arthrobacter]|uniref:ParB/RepB/Spo0J family partition protein n=2 Tax=Arthrobacter TaxID=1663 RepID=A0ABU9KJ15_9MICC|nr:ParB/RepB/Spo0J family partition protein [Arthrobacter sp. YJM1]MDP5226866.1 ParB/RepB/Spo0J family partition protein [Arthrobacter sp. YJM1]
MTEKRRGLGRGLGALIPNSPDAGEAPTRPVDLFFPTPPREKPAVSTASSGAATSLQMAPVKSVKASKPAASSKAVKDPADADAPASAGPRARKSAPKVAPSAARQRPSAKSDPELPIAEIVAETIEADGLVPVPGARFAEVPVTEITPNPRQPRQEFDEQDMAELVHSVREIGVLQPIVVREKAQGSGYELVMGERRWRAAQEAGLSAVPAIIRVTTDDDLLRDALLENLHRSQLNPIEEAAAYQQLLEDFGATHEELADRIGRSRPQVSNTIRLLKLPPLVQRRVAAGVLSAGHARALLGLPDAAAIERVAQKIVAEGLSVRATEEAVVLFQAPEEPKKSTTPRNTARHERLDYLASSLSDRLDTNVKITLGARKGRVSIEFASVDDLNRIMDVINPS